jgi:hypothetical protein
MGKIVSGKQWKIVLVGDIDPNWPDNPVQIGMMIQSALSLNMLLMQCFKWSNIEFSQLGQDFPTP